MQTLRPLPRTSQTCSKPTAVCEHFFVTIITLMTCNLFLLNSFFFLVLIFFLLIAVKWISGEIHVIQHYQLRYKFPRMNDYQRFVFGIVDGLVWLILTYFYVVEETQKLFAISMHVRRKHCIQRKKRGGGSIRSDQLLATLVPASSTEFALDQEDYWPRLFESRLALTHD